jgi:hypothetical protein
MWFDFLLILVAVSPLVHTRVLTRGKPEGPLHTGIR